MHYFRTVFTDDFISAPMMPENEKRIAAQEGIPSQVPTGAAAVEKEGVAVMAEQRTDLYGIERCLDRLKQRNGFITGHGFILGTG